ncbi:Kinesin-like protein KIN-14F [Arabidopsis thaliana]
MAVHHVKAMEVTSSSYHKVLEENRLLYNEVQDLKGTIRVYCRVRPFFQEQKDMQSTVDYIGENGNIIINNPFKQEKDARKIFAFNKVFGQTVSQEQIYIDTQPVIRSVLDGFNVCIFAYGQTGSGKTYTMSGPDLMTETTCGVNYRALRDLFQLSNARTHVVTYEIGVQMIEIYNEQVRDLLNPVILDQFLTLDIRNNSQLNGLNVPDANLIPVSNTRDVLDLMRIGQKNRAVGATALNERSSRSHSVLTVHVQGKELASGSILRGCLHLVDLAGSERVEKSEAVGERLKEAQHINKSLSALGDVIYALAQKSSHVPYRNSKLTQVLQDSLGGQAKTLMFVHINPEVNAVGETISTLKFAQRVASIELGAARSNKETGEIRDLKDEVHMASVSFSLCKS